MQSVVLTKDWTIQVEDRPVPPRLPDHVIVDVELCGICGSDLHAADLAQVYRVDTIIGH